MRPASRVLGHLPDHADRRGAGAVPRALTRPRSARARRLRRRRHASSRAGSALALVLLGRRAGSPRSFISGHPERAWRSAAKWRTSWLSREVIVLPPFIGGVSPTARRITWPASAARSWIGALGCRLLRRCSSAPAMIYACLKFLQEWASPLTLVNFIVLGCASGFTLAAGWAGGSWPLGDRCREAAIALTARRAGQRASPRWCATPASGRNRRCRRRSASSIRESRRKRRASWAARSTRASSSTASHKQITRRTSTTRRFPGSTLL